MTELADFGQRYATPPLLPLSDSNSDSDTEEDGEWRPEYYSSDNDGDSSIDSVKSVNLVAAGDGDRTPVLEASGNEDTQIA